MHKGNLMWVRVSARVHVFPQSMKAPELKERLEESEKLIQEMTVTWEEKLRKTEEIAQVTIYRCAACSLISASVFHADYKMVMGKIKFLCAGEAKAVGESGHLSAVIRDPCGRG